MKLIMKNVKYVIGLKECDLLWLIFNVLLIKYILIFLDMLIFFLF